MKQKLTFEEWEKAVDEAVLERVGCGLHDLPDFCTRDWYDAGETPASTAKEAIRASREQQE